MCTDAARVSPLLKQIWTVAGVLFSIISQGMAQGFISVLLTDLMKSDSPIEINIHLASWLVSGMAMAVVVGTVTSIILMEFFGRKVAYFLHVLPGVAGMLLMYFATDFSMLMAARLLDGISAGGTVILGAVIIGEYASPAYRGIFLNLKTAFICLGTTIVHCLGHYLHWKTVALIALVPNAISLCIVFTWPESPAWLAYRRKFQESEKSFLWLRGDTHDTRTELVDLIKAQEEKNSSELESTILEKTRTFFGKLKRKDFLRPVFVMICCCLLLETCGRHVVPAYGTYLVAGIVGSHGHSFYYMLAIDLIITISTACSSILIKLMKTRTLLFCSGISSMAVLFSGCLYLFLASQDIISSDRTWMPLTIFILYFVLVNLGCTPVSLALIGEIMPLEHKPYGIFAFGVLGYLFIVVTLKAFPFMLRHLDMYGAFGVLGLLTAVVLTLLYFTVPETKDKTLQEIEDCIRYGKPQNRGKRDEETAKMLD